MAKVVRQCLAHQTLKWDLSTLWPWSTAIKKREKKENDVHQCFQAIFFSSSELRIYLLNISDSQKFGFYLDGTQYLLT